MSGDSATAVRFSSSCAASHAVAALDLRGHGDSGQAAHPGSYDIETMAGDVLAVAQAASSKSQRRPTP